MTESTSKQAFIEQLKEHHFLLNHLPKTLRFDEITPAGDWNDMPLSDAQIDDIAFAQCALNRQLSHLISEIEALKKLQELARSLGARGHDHALDFIEKNGDIESNSYNYPH